VDKDADRRTTWLRPDELARYLECSTSTLAKKRLYGNGPPFVKLGRLCLYSREAVDDWLIARMKPSTSEKPGGDSNVC